jgi:predicted RNase H-like HicB family nuclease/predicted transcriptional regulator
MNAIVYVALAEARQDAGYVAHFPDLPSCTAAGADPAELLANARTSLRGELQILAERAEEWPVPTRVEQVQAPPPQFTLLVDVEVEDTPVRVNISIGEQLLKRLDAAAEVSGSTRSGFIAQAVRERLGEGRQGGADFEGATRRVQDELAAMGRKIQDSLGPESAFSRSMTDLDIRLSDTIRKAADNVSSAMARRRDSQSQTQSAKTHSAPAEEAAADA